MNAGRDVERLIADWFVEEAVPRAPDRVLEATGRIVTRTKQRRFGVAWREPMVITTTRLVAAAAIFIAAVVGAGWLGRQTADTGQPNPTPLASSPAVQQSATPTASPDALAELQQYRAARDAVCTAAAGERIPHIELTDPARLYDPSLSAADRGLAIVALNDIADRGDRVAAQLAAIQAPASLAAEHAQNVARAQDLVALIRHEIELLAAGKFDEGRVVDESTGSVAALAEQFEAKYALAPCP